MHRGACVNEARAPKLPGRGGEGHTARAFIHPPSFSSQNETPPSKAGCSDPPLLIQSITLST